MTEDIVVTRVDAAHQYEAHKGGQLAGFVDFVEHGDAIRFTHTESLPDFRGQGVGDALASFALSDAVARGLRIVPLCPYIARYLRRHEVPGAVVEWPEETP